MKKYIIKHIKTRDEKWWIWQEKRGAHYFMCECDKKSDAMKIKRALEEGKS